MFSRCFRSPQFNVFCFVFTSMSRNRKPMSQCYISFAALYAFIRYLTLLLLLLLPASNSQQSH